MDGPFRIPDVIVTWDTHQLIPYVTRYIVTGNLYVYLNEVDADGGPEERYTNVTTNHADWCVPDTHLMIKDWTENRGIVAPLQAAKLIGEREVLDPTCPYPIYRLVAKLPAALPVREKMLK